MFETVCDEYDMYELDAKNAVFFSVHFSTIKEMSSGLCMRYLAINAVLHHTCIWQQSFQLVFDSKPSQRLYFLVCMVSEYQHAFERIIVPVKYV